MAINIKNERTIDTVKRLASRLGVTYTTAIDTAAEAALARPPASSLQRTRDEVRRITADYRAHLDKTASLETEALYDADGLFR